MFEGFFFSKTCERGIPPLLHHPKFTVNKEEPSPAVTFSLC